VLSFAYIGYQEKQFSTVPTGASLSLTLAQFVSLIVSVSLFAVGYIELMFAKPRSVERRARFREGALMASLTFLLLFVVVGYTWGLPISIQSYFYLRDYASFWGLIVGAIGGFALVFAKKSYSRISRRGIRTEAIPVSCAGCGMVLESLASFCSGCGSPVSGPDPIPEEKVVFKGAGRVLLRGTRHHSLTRKLVSLIAGGPLGFLFFGMDETRKLEADGELFVTPSFFRCGRSDYPFERVVGLGRTLPAPSVVLALKKGSGVEKQLGWGGLKGELRKLIAELTVRDHAALLGGLHKSVTEPRL
ncbi:MAG TPA: hypothetical protein VFE96_03170, partial [Candidatus Bathyarchaeia archaeon]|nr:hypothetical protein [Candidatus Bathyarchaeia archaeon]